MWQQICLKNKDNISRILGAYIEELNRAKLSIDAGNERELFSFFESSRDYRNSMPDHSAGPIKKIFALYCDIIDEAGGIATIATILAAITSALKILESFITGNLKKGYCASNFTKRTPL